MHNKFNIKVSKDSGFCFGVRRADKIVNELAAVHRKVYIYGELIHNSDYIKKLESKGIVTFENLNDIAVTSDDVCVTK